MIFRVGGGGVTGLGAARGGFGEVGRSAHLGSCVLCGVVCCFVGVNLEVGVGGKAANLE